MYRLENRLTRLERYREEAGEDSAVTIHILLGGQPEVDQMRLEPGTRVLHVTLDNQPTWWGEIGEDGQERWVFNA